MAEVNTDLNLLRSVQAHGATHELGWGYCYAKALAALTQLQDCEPETVLPGFPDDDSFWDDARYAEGWMVTFGSAPAGGTPGKPHWVSHGFLLAGGGQVVDPMTGKAALERGVAAINTRAWIPVFTYERAELLGHTAPPFWGGVDPGNEDSELPELLVAARREHESWALDRAAQLRQQGVGQ